jgi:hypothetical protein
MIANQAVFSGNGGIPVWTWVLMAVAFLCPLWWIGSIFYSGQAPYDRLTSTRVVRAGSAGAYPANHS